MTTDLLFVYGTLKRGFRNHRLLAPADYIGPAKTERRFRLLDCGEYPALVEVPAKSLEIEPLEIQGEIFRIGPELLPALDELEDEGKLYRRTTLPIYLSADPAATPVVAWTYLWLGRADRFQLVAGDAWPTT
jgi:gamma-glutamylaminecyclotransferase